ncbi:MAG TPA: PAS domain-containing protein, partial [Thermoanaerobaculia bacterium]|nr:PAS domain-containing protein [Thermoanaerobaculia bacterium]
MRSSAPPPVPPAAGQPKAKRAAGRGRVARAASPAAAARGAAAAKAARAAASEATTASAGVVWEGLPDADEQYRLLFERNPLPMWVYDFVTLRFLAVNQAAVHLYGYSRDEFLAMTIN